MALCSSPGITKILKNLSELRIEGGAGISFAVRALLKDGQSRLESGNASTRNKASRNPLENSFNKRSNSGNVENVEIKKIKRIGADQEQIQGSIRSSKNARRQEFRRDPLVELLRA